MISPFEPSPQQRILDPWDMTLRQTSQHDHLPKTGASPRFHHHLDHLGMSLYHAEAADTVTIPVPTNTAQFLDTLLTRSLRSGRRLPSPSAHNNVEAHRSETSHLPHIHRLEDCIRCTLVDQFFRIALLECLCASMLGRLLWKGKGEECLTSALTRELPVGGLFTSDKAVREDVRCWARLRSVDGDLVDG